MGLGISTCDTSKYWWRMTGDDFLTLRVSRNPLQLPGRKEHGCDTKEPAEKKNRHLFMCRSQKTTDWPINA
jgi:hypothetical protein